MRRGEFNLMEYRGIRYTIRAGIERGHWFVAIHPQGVEVGGNKVVHGTRESAELFARRLIKRWLSRQGKLDRRSNEPGRFE